jgi:hypothetical protein
MTARRSLAVLTVTAIAVFGAGLSASGRIGFYGIVEKVVFEPNETAPERLQVWGAFMYVDGGASQSIATSPAKRGYLYFRISSNIPNFTPQSQIDLAKKEWADLKAVAGTGQAIGFGHWGYFGSFGALEPDRGSEATVLVGAQRAGEHADLRVRPATEAPSAPATYQTETGIVKLNDAGSHATVVKQLRDALKR